jgi:hypothetical protein
MKRSKYSKEKVRSGQLNFAIGRLKGAAVSAQNSMHQIMQQLPDATLYNEVRQACDILVAAHVKLKRRRSSVKN